MREEVFITGRTCSDCLHTDGRLTNGSKTEKCIMKEFGEPNNCKMSVPQNDKIAQNREKIHLNNAECLESQEENITSSQSRKIPLPKVTITRPFSEKIETTETSHYRNDTYKGKDEDNEDAQKSGGKLAGRRALPEITITCPPVEAFDYQDEDLTDGIFTRRKYMICKDSPRSGKKTISLVDFPHGLSELEGNDLLYLESPANSLDSPHSFSNVDLTFTYNSPLGSPFTPPFTPEMTKPSKFIYPGPVPVFSIDQSFPPAEFKDEKLTAE